MKIKVNPDYQTLILFLLWISGMIKPFINLYLFEFDIVLFALIIACLDMLIVGVSKFKKPSVQFIAVFLSIALLYTYLIFTLTFTPSENYGYVKTMNFLPNLVFFTYGAFVRKINIRLFLKCYCWVLIPVAIFFVYMKSIVWSINTKATTIFKEIRNHYLAVGLHLGILFLVCQVYYRKIWLLLLTLFLLFASSARGALLFTIITFFVFEIDTIIKFKIKKKLFYAITSTTCLATIITFLFSGKIASLLENSLVRFSVLFSGGSSSTNNRLDAMSYAITESFSSLSNVFVGNGIASFGFMYQGVDGRLYPHNLFVEVLFELGLIGIFFLLTILAITFYSAPKGKKIFFMLFFFFFLNAMKSSNLTDLWIFFSAIGILLNQKNFKLIV